MGSLWRVCVKMCEEIQLLFGLVGGVGWPRNSSDAPSSQITLGFLLLDIMSLAVQFIVRKTRLQK